MAIARRAPARPSKIVAGAADRLLMFLLGAIGFQLVEIIRTWP